MISNDGNNSTKVVLLGNSGTGKTSILQSKLNHSMSETSLPTIGCVYQEVEITIDGEVISLKVWDTAGQEIYRSIVPIYVRGAAAAILVYDVSTPTSLSSLGQWLSILQEESEDVHVYVVANKIDLTDKYLVDDKEGKNFASQINAQFFRVSAKESSGISELFYTIAKNLKNNGICNQNLIKENDQTPECC